MEESAWYVARKTAERLRVTYATTWPVPQKLKEFMLNKSCSCTRGYRNSDSSAIILSCNDILKFVDGCKVQGPCLGDGSWRGDVADLFCGRMWGGTGSRRSRSARIVRRWRRFFHLMQWVQCSFLEENAYSTCCFVNQVHLQWEVFSIHGMFARSMEMEFLEVETGTN